MSLFGSVSDCGQVYRQNEKATKKEFGPWRLLAEIAFESLTKIQIVRACEVA